MESLKTWLREAYHNSEEYQNGHDAYLDPGRVFSRACMFEIQVVRSGPHDSTSLAVRVCLAPSRFYKCD